MVPTTADSLPSSSIALHYRLTEADVRCHVRSGRARACRRICRDQGWGMIPLLALGLLLFGLCWRSHGFRPVGRAIAATAAVLGGFAWLREARTCRRACRMARDLGIPLDLRLTVTPEGITQEPAPDGSDPGRTFAWSQVAGIDRVDPMTVIRLQPAHGVLLIPDRAFADAAAAGQFAARARDWQRAAAPRDAGPG